MTSTRSLVASLALACLAGCGSAEPAPSDAKLVRYDDLHKARTDVEIMLGKLKVEEKERVVLLRELDKLLAEPEVVRHMKELGLNAVSACTGGSGGLIVKAGGGSGLVCFAGGRPAVPVDVSGWTAGAAAGGQSVAAVGVVCGLASERAFAGEYNVTVQGAVGGEIGSTRGSGQAKVGPQVIHWVGTAVGFGGDLSAGTLTISFADPPE